MSESPTRSQACSCRLDDVSIGTLERLIVEIEKLRASNAWKRLQLIQKAGRGPEAPSVEQKLHNLTPTEGFGSDIDGHKRVAAHDSKQSRQDVGPRYRVDPQADQSITRDLAGRRVRGACDVRNHSGHETITGTISISTRGLKQIYMIILHLASD